MSRRWFLFAIATVLSCAAVSAARAEQTLTYPDLVGRMTDLQRLSTLPATGERCARRRVTTAPASMTRRPASTSTGVQRRRRRHHSQRGRQVVVAEIEGPGCIWRIWSAAAGQGHVEIYLDGEASRPSICRSRTTSPASTAPFNYPMLSYNLAKVGCQGQKPLRADPLPEIVQDRGRPELGRLLPFHLQHLSEGHETAHLQQ